MSELKIFTLKNANGLELRALNFGAIIKSLTTPDGKNWVLGFADQQDYLTKNTAYLGCIIGRLANRVANAQFTLDNEIYHLDANENQHTLHSGQTGLHQVFWEVKMLPSNNTLELTYHSLADEGGFPGNLDLRLRYKLTDDNQLIITYYATCDRATPVDLTNHTYWQLKDEPNILPCLAQFFTTQMLETNNMIPTGRILNTADTPFDFHTPKAIATDYDHYFVLPRNNGLQLAAKITDPSSGRSLTVSTTEAGFQFYTGHFLTTPFQRHQGFCIETQHYPNAVNLPCLPSPILKPGEEYRQTTVFQLDF